MAPPPGSRPHPDADEPETSRSEQGDQASAPQQGAPPPLRQQLMGACRADERLRPLLTLNVSCSAADDRFVSHLSQHFEVSEVGMLARCLCVPLVSLRVGKVQRHGALLCPTTTRGKLNLGLLPSSSMRLTFSGDDGYSEQLTLLNSSCEHSEAVIEEIPADTSGRSFEIRISKSKVYYYWCAEKSKEHGMELLTKMKNLLDGRPTLADLTGISVSRLDTFATHLNTYLLTSSIGDVKSLSSVNESQSNSRAHNLYLQPNPVVSKTSRFRVSPINATKANSVYQTRLSPRSGTFKDGVTKTCTKVVGKEKLKQRGEWSGLSTVPIDANSFMLDTINLETTGENSVVDRARSIVTSVPLNLPLPYPSLPSIYPHTTCPLPEVYSEKQFKPYYCWCPPGPSLQFSGTPLHLPATSVEPLPLPPLSSLLSNESPPSSVVCTKLDTTAIPSLTLPTILCDPLLHLPLPTSPLVSLHGSQFPTFTPLMSDPIVHIPVIDVCSAGQAYLVSCGPSISSTVPLLPSLKPLLQEHESMVERSARETLMRLIASTPSTNGAPLVNIFPAVVPSFPENIPRVHNANKNVVATDCCVDMFRCGIRATLHSEDKSPTEEESNATLSEYDDTSNDCDIQHFQEL